MAKNVGDRMGVVAAPTAKAPRDVGCRVVGKRLPRNDPAPGALQAERGEHAGERRVLRVTHVGDKARVGTPRVLPEIDADGTPVNAATDDSNTAHEAERKKRPDAPTAIDRKPQRKAAPTNP